MPDNNQKFIKRIKLTDGSVHYVYDVNAPRLSDLDNYLPLTGGTITGNLTVDEKLHAGSIQIDTIEFQESAVTSVLTIDSNGNLKQRSANNLLEDIGGCSYSMDSASGALSFKIGRQ